MHKEDTTALVFFAKKLTGLSQGDVYKMLFQESVFYNRDLQDMYLVDLISDVECALNLDSGTITQDHILLLDFKNPDPKLDSVDLAKLVIIRYMMENNHEEILFNLS